MLKTTTEIKKDIEELNKVKIELAKKGLIDWELNKKIEKLQALLQQNNEIIEEIDNLRYRSKCPDCGINYKKAGLGECRSCKTKKQFVISLKELDKFKQSITGETK